MVRVGILAGRAVRERQCTLEWQAWYVNVWSSIHSEEECTLGVQIFLTDY